MKSKQYLTARIILSAIAVAIGIVLVILKMYAYIGIILLSLGGMIFGLSLEARRKKIVSDELTEWISGKSADVSFWAVWTTIVLLLAVDIYDSTLLQTYVALGIVMIAMVAARMASEYYYGNVKKEIGF